jgi:anti-sigma factor ChrR (cupin superfamily)
MKITGSENRCSEAERVSAHALGALPRAQGAEVEAHVADCASCRSELSRLRRTVDAFVAWPTDVVRPSRSVQARLASRIAAETGEEPVLPPPSGWREPEWQEVAPGISCKLLANDTEAHRVSMLVRLAPGVSYPPHVHAGVEELHLLDGELWIDENKLQPGDYYRAEAGSSDRRVWSETGCTCVLVTSPRDTLL